MEYRIEMNWHEAHNGVNQKPCWMIFQRRLATKRWSVLVGGIPRWQDRDEAETYLARFIAEKDAACARAALGVAK